MLTIDEYLSVIDWQFNPNVKKGQVDDFYWVRSPEFAGTVDVLEHVDLPAQPFSVLVTDWDGSGGGAQFYGPRQGWRLVGQSALSEPSCNLPELSYGADNAQMLIDHAISDEALLSALTDFCEPHFLDDPDGSQSFWNAINAIQPYCYFSYGCSAENFTFIARGKSLIDQFWQNVSLPKVELKLRQGLVESRAKTWNTLGPECGPEVCQEANCDRLRIKLAVRCFIHQLEWVKAS